MILFLDAWRGGFKRYATAFFVKWTWAWSTSVVVLSVDLERKCWLVAPRGGTGSRPPPNRLPCRSEYNRVQTTCIISWTKISIAKFLANLLTIFDKFDNFFYNFLTIFDRWQWTEFAILAMFSVTGHRTGSDVVHLLTYWLSSTLMVSIDLTDVTLVSDDI